MSWFLYLAKCKDGTLYTGITTDVKRREKEHNQDNRLGARSLRGKRPIRIVYIEEYSNQQKARKREIDIKGWKRKYKLKLITELRVETKDFKKIIPGLPGKSNRIIPGP